MAGQASVSQAAANARALNQNLQATTVPGSVRCAGADQASQFALGLVLLILLLMHQ